MKSVGKYTNVAVQALMKPGVYGDGGGLYLQVRAVGQRSWLFRYKLNGKAHWMGLGGFPAVTLAQARNQAELTRRKLRDGIDPITERRAAKAATQLTECDTPSPPTFGEVTAAYIAAHEAEWKNAKHRQQWRNTMATYCAPLNHAPVEKIDNAAVLGVLEPIWTTKTETAKRVKSRIEAILDYARARGFRHGENPARWRGHLSLQLAKPSKVAPVEHHPAMPWKDVPAFMARLAAVDGASALALRFLILTSTRSGETRGAQWSEIDLESGVWTIPWRRMKARREFRVPLSEAALALVGLAAVSREDRDGPDLLFPSPKETQSRQTLLSDMALTMQLRRMGNGHFTAHGFRSSFREWVAETGDFSHELGEAALAHKTRDKTVAAYQRSDLLLLRREMMEAWAKHCVSAIPTGHSGDGI